MKLKFSYLFKVTLFACAAMLFTQCKGEGTSSNANTTQNYATTTANGEFSYKIAYVEMDSLLMNYNYWTDINEAMMKKQEDMSVTINQKIRDFENDYRDFQRKVDNNAFLSRDRAEQEQKRLLKKQQDVEALQNKMAQELSTEAQKNDLEIRDAINTFIAEYNKEKGFSLILSNTGTSNLLYADKALDITKEVVDGLNARYANKK